jgi:membrane protein YdbS with pleckstrin-like domain
MSMGLLLGVVIGFSLALEWDLYIPWYVAALVVWTLFGLFRGHVRWRHTQWLLDDTGFRIQRGWLWQSEVLVPRARVQHLDIDRGPIERRFGLATLTVYTAGIRSRRVACSITTRRRPTTRATPTARSCSPGSTPPMAARSAA